MNIPTAEEYLDIKFPNFEDLDNGNIWVNIEETMIEFAKSHVEAALKVASEKIDFLRNQSISEEDGETIIYDYEIDKDSILNAYPLTNIK